MSCVKIRPHHLLDILRDYGNRVVPGLHPFGASVESVTKRVLNNESIELVPRVDDICHSCSMLKGVCQAKIRDDLYMRDYNDQLDDKLFELLGFKPGEQVSLKSFLEVVKSKLDDTLSLFTSPDNNIYLRRKGTLSSINEILYR